MSEKNTKYSDKLIRKEKELNDLIDKYKDFKE